MPHNRTYRRTSPNSSRRSHSKRTGGAHQRSRSTSRESRGRSPNVHAQNAKFADAPSSTSYTLREAARLATELGTSRMSPQAVSTSIMGTVKKIPKEAIHGVLYAVLGILVMVAAQHGAENSIANAALTQSRIAANNLSCAERGMGSYNAATQLCKKPNHSGMSAFEDSMFAGLTGSRGWDDAQIGAPNSFSVKRFHTIHEEDGNVNDSAEYNAAMDEARRIERDELWPALHEANRQKSILDAHLKNVQAGERAENRGESLNIRKSRIVAESASSVAEILPVKNAADKRVVEAQKHYDDAVKMAHAAESASRK